MKKRVWAIVCLTLFITAQTLTNIKVMASTIDSFGQELLDYMTLESMSIALTEGAELDWADLDLGDAALSAEEKARKMLSYYRNKAWQLEKNGLLGIVDMMSDVSVVEAQTPAISFSLNSGLSNSTINSLYNQVSNNALGLSNDDYILLMNNPTVAYWNKYNNLYLNQYLEDMKYEANPPFEVPEEYRNLVAKANGMLLGNSQHSPQNVLRWYYGGSPSIVNFGDTYSYVTDGDYDENTWGGYVYILTSADIYINSQTNVITYSLIQAPQNVLTLSWRSTFDGSWSSRSGNRALNSLNYSTSDYTGVSSLENVDISALSLTTNFNSLTDALTYVSKKFRNANIYVDGALWTTTTIDTGWDVSIPNAVTDTGTDDGKIVANPIFWAVDENTGANVDEWQINLTDMMQKIIDKIDAGQTSISMQDLVDTGAVEGTDGVAIGVGTGVVAGTKSLADAIAKARDVSITDNPAITLEDVAAEAVPGLPSLPVMPAGMPGFGGVTVLARIVNFANQSLPTELIVTFWGVVFGAVVLGIIKVLHK